MTEMKDCPVFISSSDSYSDLWPVFFELFKRHWPGYKGKIYLNTEEKEFSFAGLDIICTKTGQNIFGRAFRAGLDKIESERVLLIMIDYLFMDSVRDSKLPDYYNFFVENDLDSLCLTYLEYPNTCKSDHEEIMFVHPPARNLMFSYQVAFWKKQVLRQMALPHENPWTSEWYGSRRAEVMKIRLAAISDKKFNPFPYDLAGCIHKGGWTEVAVDYLKNIYCEMDFNSRGIYKEAPQNLNEKVKVKWMIIRDGLSGSSVDLMLRKIANSYKLKDLAQRFKLRMRAAFTDLTKNSPVHPFFYKSFWHYKMFGNNGTNNADLYFSAAPNPGAGIGHQLANWISGYWYARQLGLKFAHSPFPDPEWERFLGLGEGEITVAELSRRGYKKVRLPLFDGSGEQSLDLTRRIIASYSDRKVIFLAEQDQFYREQHGVMTDLRRKFHNAASRKNNRSIYSNDNFNIAVHVRRGDLQSGISRGNKNYIMRWQDNSYFIKILSTVIPEIKSSKPIHIYLFSEGRKEDFSDFEVFDNMNFCLDMHPREAFLHLVYADLLITSKSSFSYKPALLSRGLKVCPENFWHGYPRTDDFVLADDSGKLQPSELNKISAFR